ncbi:MAG: arylesterase [Bacteriovoracaceae bacterium]
MKFLILLLLFISTSLLAQTKVLILGDSLTEGFGVEKEEGFVSLLHAMLKKDGFPDIQVINAGIGGSTSASGVSRLEWHLKSKVTHLVLALGSNDALRGVTPADTEKNLKAVIEKAQAAHLKILLLGAKSPPNYSKKFTQEFDGIYPKLAQLYKIPLVPFILDGVAGNPKLNQADGIHPNPEGHKIMALKLIKPLKAFL